MASSPGKTSHGNTEAYKLGTLDYTFNHFKRKEEQRHAMSTSCGEPPLPVRGGLVAWELPSEEGGMAGGSGRQVVIATQGYRVRPPRGPYGGF